MYTEAAVSEASIIQEGMSWKAGALAWPRNGGKHKQRLIIAQHTGWADRQSGEDGNLFSVNRRLWTTRVIISVIAEFLFETIKYLRIKSYEFGVMNCLWQI